MIGFVIKLEIDEKSLLDAVKKDPKMAPHSVIVDSPYARYVEFGSLPAKSKTETVDRMKKAGGEKPKKKKSPNSQFYRAIWEWAGEKLGVDEKERDRVARAIYYKILRDGVPPQPYLRPAVHMVVRRHQGGVGSGATVESIADEIAEEAQRFLEEHGTNYHNALSRSIEVEKTDEDRLPVTDDPDVKDLWWDEELHGVGNKEPVYYGKGGKKK